MAYSDLTLRHFGAASASGELTGPGVFRGAAGRIAEGTWVQFDVRFDADGASDRILEARFRAFGCPHVIAVCDWLCHQVRGTRADVNLPWRPEDLRTQFDAPIEKLGRLLVIEDAWIAALRSAKICAL